MRRDGAYEREAYVCVLVNGRGPFTEVFFIFFSLSGPCLVFFWRKGFFLVLVGAGCVWAGGNGSKFWRPLDFLLYFLCVRNISTEKIRPDRK